MAGAGSSEFGRTSHSRYACEKFPPALSRQPGTMLQ
ncbi:hypothetical protein Hsero_1274 [Herbaspirillum seropedicae SmR1]|uniref:Uncharacterized protein n=1 Tax=Herbaspirillum seropedicae (strain SmR1) TaxID=757424 RepID=D8INX0_HERSS|nr:hypothetical protein Hsero_1274 [Herbaspirillum seropedicae SmR1]